MRRVSYLLYGVVSYAIFLAVFLYAVGFVGNFGTPTRLDGPATTPLMQALLINAGLLAAFALQHSGMARPTFKRWWTKIVPEPAERSTYVMVSNIAMIALFILWQPMGGSVWNVTNPIGKAVLFGLYALGYAIVLLATFAINHFDLFGLRQSWLAFRGRPYTRLQLGRPLFYRSVRHPLYVGWLLVFWATPTMTAAHLFFAVMTTAYILVAIQLEERNLIDEHGESYRQYRREVPMLIPRVSAR